MSLPTLVLGLTAVTAVIVAVPVAGWVLGLRFYGRLFAGPEAAAAALRLHTEWGHLKDRTRVYGGKIEGVEARLTVFKGQALLEVEMAPPEVGFVSCGELLGRPLAVRAREPQLTAALGVEGRAALAGFLSRPGADVINGRLVWRGPGAEETLVGLAREMAALALRLNPPEASLPGALLANLEQAHEAGERAARARNLRALLRYFPHSSQAARARTLLAEEPDRAVRSLLAPGRGASGLGDITELLLDDTANHSAVLAAIEQLGRLRHQPALEGLLHRLSSDQDEVVAAAVEALRRLRSPAAIRPLVGVLDRPEVGLRMAAINALEEVGDAWAAAALRDWGRRNRRDHQPSAAARLAAARLEERHGALTGGELGAFALSGPAGGSGALSLSAAPGGLSLLDE